MRAGAVRFKRLDGATPRLQEQLGYAYDDSEIMFKLVAMLSVLALGVSGCDQAQHGRFVTLGDRYLAFSSAGGGIDIVEGCPSREDNFARGSNQDLLYLIFVSAKSPLRHSGGNFIFGPYVTTINHIWSTGTTDLTVSLDWDRQKDTVAVRTQNFFREKGNVFVVRLDAQGEDFCRQLASLGPHSSFQQVLTHIHQQLPNDKLIASLQLTGSYQ